MYKLLLIIMAGTMFFNTNAQNKTSMNVEELIKKAASDSSYVILDVRTPQELKDTLGKIDGVINIPLQQLEDRFNELKPYKDKEIAVICRSGNRSRYATDFLNKNGYKAINVAGGMIDYRRYKSK